MAHHHHHHEHFLKEAQARTTKTCLVFFPLVSIEFNTTTKDDDDDYLTKKKNLNEDMAKQKWPTLCQTNRYLISSSTTTITLIIYLLNYSSVLVHRKEKLRSCLILFGVCVCLYLNFALLFLFIQFLPFGHSIFYFLYVSSSSSGHIRSSSSSKMIHLHFLKA